MFNKCCTLWDCLLFACCLWCLLWHVPGLENGLARTPPMGWMPYERFRCITNCADFPRDCISEDLFKRMADLLVSEGYLAAGYEYLIIDDCWMEPTRNVTTGRLMPDEDRFPNGMKYLSHYIHEKGLKFGLYHDIGEHTCMNQGPGASGHYALDAETFAEWDVDYVKMDGCYTENVILHKAYPKFGLALNRTGRPMVYSCSWPFYERSPNYKLVKEHCNLWRFAGDIREIYDSVIQTMHEYYKKQEKLVKVAGPGHWNDPDMLVLGNFRLSYEGSRLQLAIWAIMAAPLIMTNDLETVRPEIKALLQKRDVIAVSQDALGMPGQSVYTEDEFQVWTRPILPMNNIGLYSYAVAFVLHGHYGPCPLCPRNFKVALHKLGLKNELGYMVYDLFNISHCLGLFKAKDKFGTRVNPQGVTFYKFKAEDHY